MLMGSKMNWEFSYLFVNKAPESLKLFLQIHTTFEVVANTEKGFQSALHPQLSSKHPHTD